MEAGQARPPSDGLAAVDDQGVAGREGRGVRAQPEHGGGDLLRCAETSDRLVRDEGLAASGVLCAKRSIIAVSMMPGQTALMRMPEAA
ncbi:hypothetical protein GCM10023083_01760 [Streptomyces phyllanthi]